MGWAYDGLAACLANSDCNIPAPQLAITAPSAVSQPVLQLQGTSSEPLSSVTYQVGTLTGQEGYVTHQHFDPGLEAFTTASFECVDVLLEAGDNAITVTATDLAGNQATWSQTINYTDDGNPPALTLYWPQNNASLSGDSFTIRGLLDDPTATVTAEITDGNGIINQVAGLVERNGLLWVEDLPLGPGANTVLLTMTDAAGHSSAENLTVNKIDPVVTIGDLSGTDVNQPRISVSGTVTQTGYKVWVNGKEAAINGQSWLAEDVPLQDAGCALVQARAIPLSDNNGYGTGGSGGTSSTMANPGNPVSAQAKDAEANVDKPDEIVEVLYHKARVDYWVREDGLDETVTEDTFWGRNQTGHSYSDDCYGSSEVRYYTWFDADWNERDEGTSQSGGSPACGVKTASEPQPYGHPEWMDEFCSVQAHRVDADEFHTFQRVRAREAVTAYELHTGGKAAIQRQNLFALTGLAYGIGNPFYPEVDSDAQAYAIPYTSVKLGTLGYLGSDSYLYKALPDNKSLDVTPNVPGRPYYRYSQPDRQKYRLWILANNIPLAPDHVAPLAKFCVGQKMSFAPQWTPGTPPYASADYLWAIPERYVNHQWQLMKTIGDPPAEAQAKVRVSRFGPSGIQERHQGTCRSGLPEAFQRTLRHPSWPPARRCRAVYHRRS